MRAPTTRRAALLPLVAVPLLLAGCGSGGSAASGTTVATSSAAAASTEDRAAAEAAQFASNTPPEAARMVCEEAEVRGAVADALGLGAIPAPTAAWADHVYTCTYALPTGRLVLAVTVTPSTAAARDRLSQLRTRLGATVQEPGLGQQAWSAPSGTVVAAKDNMVLTVDPSGLPDDIGATHEHRLDFARVMAAVVFNCWTGAS
jgi:hypothetical protein